MTSPTPLGAEEPESILVATITIPNGQSQSAAIDLDGYGALRLHMSAAWTAAAVTVLHAPTLGGTYSPFYDDNGEYQVPNADQGRCCWLDPSKWLGLRFVKLRSGTNALAVNQAADRVLSLEFRSL